MTNTPYLVWEPIWRALFDLDSDWPVRKQIRMLESAIVDLAPERMEALPLLGSLLNLPLPENDFTEKLEPQFRKSALEALLIECLQAVAREATTEPVAGAALRRGAAAPAGSRPSPFQQSLVVAIRVPCGTVCPEEIELSNRRNHALTQRPRE